MATINLTGTWKREVQRINSQFIPGQSYAPDALVPQSTIDHGGQGGTNISQLSAPPAGLKAPTISA